MDADQQKIMTMTRHAAEQGSELVRRLLAFARRQQLEPARIDIARLSSSVDDLLAHTLGGLVQPAWRTEDDLWSASAVEPQLELALITLIIKSSSAIPAQRRVANQLVSTCRYRRFNETQKKQN